MAGRPDREPTRVREHATRVTRSTTPAEKIAAIRQIVERCQYAKVDGCTVDLFTAGAIVAVHDALNETNRARFLSLPVFKMAILAFRLLRPSSVTP